MNPAKIEIKMGEFSFCGEGEQQWLSEELAKILEKAEKIIELSDGLAKPSDVASTAAVSPITSALAGKPLAVYLKDVNATTQQNLKFLATANWLRSTKGMNRLSTSDVSKALKDANQTKLGNPAECLNQNVSKGLCEKDGKQFFVTQHGQDSLFQ